jgi:hypothetical protein
MPPGRPRKVMTLHVARWDRFTYCGTLLDRGQIVELKGAANDEKLLRLGYIEEVTEHRPAILECGECGAKFLRDEARLAHGRRRHPNRERRIEFAPTSLIDPGTGEPSAYVDTDGDREELARERETPLFLENTTASRS